MPMDQAALYEQPFEYVKAQVYPTRAKNRREAYARRWWLHVEPRPGMRAACNGLKRFLATPTVSKHRLFVWLPGETLPDHQLIVFARDDDYFLGVLHSRVHEVWARGLGTQVREVESGFRYTPTTTFETLPMPQPSSEQAEAVAAAARELNRLREGWLNPPGADAATLRRRTLTNPYNEPPTWLAQAHERLDRAVHAAYGWPYPLGDEEILERLGRPQPEPVRGAGRTAGHRVGNPVRQAECGPCCCRHWRWWIAHRRSTADRRPFDPIGKRGPNPPPPASGAPGPGREGAMTLRFF